jgi:hypothetical protein
VQRWPPVKEIRIHSDIILFIDKLHTLERRTAILDAYRRHLEKDAVRRSPGPSSGSYSVNDAPGHDCGMFTSARIMYARRSTAPEMTCDRLLGERRVRRAAGRTR